MNLAKAILKLRKTGEKRHLELFEKEVEKLITYQIELKNQEISDLKRDLKEYQDETIKEDILNFNEGLLTWVENYAIDSRTDRKISAKSYIETKIAEKYQMNCDHEDVKFDIEDTIKELEEDIKALEDLKKTLDEIDLIIENNETKE